MSYRLGVAGGGNMGGAIIAGAVSAGVIDAGAIIVADTSEAVRDRLKNLGCATTGAAVDILTAESLLLAVKPQVFPAVADIMGNLPGSKVVISVMAGLSSGAIRARLGDGARVIRVMPNTPCQIGKGMSAIAPGVGAIEGDDALAMALFEPLGATARVTEEQMYAVTAVSGSGPAYVFLLAESMERAAIELGLPPDTARLLVSQTILGAGHLLRDSEKTAEALRTAVTSPGGTTAAALTVMLDEHLPDVVVKALTAARDRGVELDG